jgi:hypothetical protein
MRHKSNHSPTWVRGTAGLQTERIGEEESAIKAKALRVTPKVRSQTGVPRRRDRLPTYEMQYDPIEAHADASLRHSAVVARRMGMPSHA